MLFGRFFHKQTGRFRDRSQVLIFEGILGRIGKGVRCFMKKLFFIVLLALPFVALANWQLANSSQRRPGYPQKYVTKVVIQVQKGTLEDNVKGIARRHGWKVIWHAKKPMHVLLETHLAGFTFVETMNQLLSHYPVQANYHFDFQHHQNTIMITENSPS